MYDYQQNHTAQVAERERAVYEKLLGQYNQLLFAATEGVYEVAIRSQAGTVVVAVDLADGLQLTYELIECLGKRVDKIEHNLNDTLAELGSETRSALDKQKAKAEKLERQLEVNRVLIGQRDATPALAQAATTTATPRQVGRPRKVRQDEMATVGALAATVPMNGARQQAQGRASSTPQA